MTSQWWAQIKAIIRLEMKKTFFAKRGLWVYLLALAPVALFLGHSIEMIAKRDQRQAIAAARPVSRDALASIQEARDDRDVTRDEIISTLGEPYGRREYTRPMPRSAQPAPAVAPAPKKGAAPIPAPEAPPPRRRQHVELLDYTDGESAYTFILRDGKLTGTSIRGYCSFGEDSLIFAGVFQFFFLRLAIFFGCVGIFMNLFRGEMLDKSLHYYLLAPVKREVLLAGKYLAGLIATTVIFTVSAGLQMLAMAWHFPSNVINQYLESGGWNHVIAYLGVTMLACLGYGSVFLAAGLLFRNPIIPAASVLLWESANLFLPAVLKKISVIFYLQSLCPIVAPPDKNMPPPLRLLVSLAEPTAPPVAVAGLILVTLAVLVMAARQVRRLEINYAAE